MASLEITDSGNSCSTFCLIGLLPDDIPDQIKWAIDEWDNRVDSWGESLPLFEDHYAVVQLLEPDDPRAAGLLQAGFSLVPLFYSGTDLRVYFGLTSTIQERVFK